MVPLVKHKEKQPYTTTGCLLFNLELAFQCDQFPNDFRYFI